MSAPKTAAMGSSHQRPRFRSAGSARTPVVVDEAETPESASRSNATSRADSNRSSGFFSRQCRTIRSRPGGTSLLVWEMSGGSFVRIAVIVSAARVPAERPLARQHLVEDRPEREEVAPLVRRPASHLLGRHVAHRPEHHAGLRAAGDRPGIGLAPVAPVQLQLRETEVQDLDPPVLRQKDVLGLQVPVHDPLLVRRGQSLRDLHRVVDRLARGDRARAQAAAQRLAFEQLRHDVRRAVVRPEFVDRRDVRVVQDARRPRLRLEALQAIRILRERRRQHLDRHLAPEPRVARAVDLSHPAGADGRENFVGTELATGGKCHLGRRDSIRERWPEPSTR